MTMVDSVRRVPMNTNPDVNARIRRQMQVRVAGCAALGPDVVQERLAELEREWDIERAIEVEAPLTALLGLTLGANVNRKWFTIPGLVGSMVFVHALQGWYPLLPVFRRLGLRTRWEIDEEIYALKALRGDFAPVAGRTEAQARAEAALQAAAILP